MDEMSEKDIETYLDGLVASNIVDKLGEDSYKINQEFYHNGIKRMENIKNMYGKITKFKTFNFAMIEEMVHVLNLSNEKEIENYVQVLVRCFYGSGVYQLLFPNDYKREMDLT